jgi:hypothetical protein
MQSMSGPIEESAVLGKGAEIRVEALGETGEIDTGGSGGRMPRHRRPHQRLRAPGWALPDRAFLKRSTRKFPSARRRRDPFNAPTLYASIYRTDDELLINAGAHRRRNRTHGPSSISPNRYPRHGLHPPGQVVNASGQRTHPFRSGGRGSHVELENAGLHERAQGS